jgi:hypothetical protein
LAQASGQLAAWPVVKHFGRLNLQTILALALLTAGQFLGWPPSGGTMDVQCVAASPGQGASINANLYGRVGATALNPCGGYYSVWPCNATQGSLTIYNEDGSGLANFVSYELIVSIGPNSGGQAQYHHYAGYFSNSTGIPPNQRHSGPGLQFGWNNGCDWVDTTSGPQ